VAVGQELEHFLLVQLVVLAVAVMLLVALLVLERQIKATTVAQEVVMVLLLVALVVAERVRQELMEHRGLVAREEMELLHLSQAQA
jgi:hypothetical protein